MCIRVLAAMLVLVCAGGAADDARPGKELSWDTPPDLDSILRGAAVGTRLSAFLPLHPQAGYSDPAKEMSAPSADDENADLEEHFDKDPLLRLWCVANYGFNEGRLEEFIVVWACGREDFEAYRPRFLQACVRKHGRQFLREAKKTDGETEGLPYAPVLVWTDRLTVYLASCAVERNAKKQVVGTFTYGAFPKDDPLLQSMFAARALTREQLEGLYAGVDEVLGTQAKRPRDTAPEPQEDKAR